MPSEPRTAQALALLSAPRSTFRSAVAMAVDQVGSFLDAHRAPLDGRAARAAQELGAFAASRLDASRFEAVFGEAGTVDPLAITRIERAYEILRQIDARGENLFLVRVPPGGDLRAQVAQALAEIGRVFRAARAAATARLGRGAGDEHDAEGGFEFREWNRAEREIAPPLVVEVGGGDLQVGGLAEFLDGRQKLVLVVRGAAPAAALVRLITPGVFVSQVADPAELAQLASAQAPGVAALVPESAARFLHLPGEAPAWERLSVQLIPDADPRAAVGSVSAFQQAEELRQLRALATRPELPSPLSSPAGAEHDRHHADAPEALVPGAPPTPAQAVGASGATAPADRLAAWLLSQTDLDGA